MTTTSRNTSRLISRRRMGGLSYSISSLLADGGSVAESAYPEWSRVHRSLSGSPFHPFSGQLFPQDYCSFWERAHRLTITAPQGETNRFRARYLVFDSMLSVPIVFLGILRKALPWRRGYTPGWKKVQGVVVNISLTFHPDRILLGGCTFIASLVENCRQLPIDALLWIRRWYCTSWFRRLLTWWRLTNVLIWSEEMWSKDNSLDTTSSSATWWVKLTFWAYGENLLDLPYKGWVGCRVGRATTAYPVKKVQSKARKPIRRLPILTRQGHIGSWAPDFGELRYTRPYDHVNHEKSKRWWCTNFYGRPLPETDWIGEVGMCTSLLSVHLDQLQFLPHPINEVVKAGILVNKRANRIMWSDITHLRSCSALITTVWGWCASLSTNSKLIASTLL